MLGSSDDNSLSRRRLLRNGALLGTGAVAGGTVASGSADAARDTTRAGFISLDSARKLFADGRGTGTGSTWDGTFSVRRRARDFGSGGVYIDVPETCDGDEESRRFRGYLITAATSTSCSGGPSGEGPWVQDRCTWLFLDTDSTVRFNDMQVVTGGRHRDSAAPCHEAVQPRNGAGDPVGAEFPVVRLTFSLLPEANDRGSSHPFSRL